MKPATVNLTIRQGSTFERVIAFKNEDGSTFDLTNYTAVLQARETPDSSQIIINSEGASPNITLSIDTVTGTLTMKMTPTQTAALDFTTIEWNLEMSINGETHRWFEGLLTLSKEVAK